MRLTSSEFWSKVPHFASFVTAMVAIFALWDTARTTRESARTQSIALATSLLKDYMQLALSYPDLANRSDVLPVDPRYEWFAAHAFVSAEAIYRLMAGQPVWDSTVSGIIQYHSTFVRDGKFACSDFDQGFTVFVERQLGPTFKCMRL